MKIIKFFKLIVVSTTLFVFGTIACIARTSTIPIYINGPDSSVHAHVLSEESRTKPEGDHRYYWYSKNTILSSDGSFSGRLLHGQYTAYYPDHNLLAQGAFIRGLKTGKWISWFPGGGMHERSHFSKGKLNGPTEVYDSTGRLTVRIYYRNGVRDGKTKFFSQDKSDSVIRFKKGHEVVRKKRVDSTKPSGKKKSDTLIQSNNNRKADSAIKKPKAGPRSREGTPKTDSVVGKVSSGEKKISSKDTAEQNKSSGEKRKRKLKNFFFQPEQRKVKSPE